MQKTIAIFGIGYIGLPLTAAFANVGFKVIGVDINQERVEQLKKGFIPLFEPGVKETLERCKDSIEFTSDPSYAMKKADAAFITVGTPLKDDKDPDYSYVDSCIEQIGKNLRKGHLIVLKSTVILGTTEEHVMPQLEKLSGLNAGKDFFLAFCPERTMEGVALQELYALPKIIGGINDESASKTKEIVEKLGGKVTIVSSPKVAEMCKLADNLYRAMNIAFANELGEVCRAGGINASEMVATVNKEFGRTNVFLPGLGADGPCLTKDPHIFRYSALVCKK